jgi:hypothetical protein
MRQSDTACTMFYFARLILVSDGRMEPLRNGLSCPSAARMSSWKICTSMLYANAVCMRRLEHFGTVRRSAPITDLSLALAHQSHLHSFPRQQPTARLQHLSHAFTRQSARFADIRTPLLASRHRRHNPSDGKLHAQRSADRPSKRTVCSPASVLSKSSG